MPNHDGEHVCVCGKLYTTIDKLKHHQRYYCRPLEDDDDVCKICAKQFKSYAGVRQHMRRAHPAQYNDGLEAEDRRRHRPWAAMENLDLARAELAYGGYDINRHLAALFPERTLDMIKSHRRSQDYKNLRDRMRAEIEEAEVVGPIEDPSNASSSSEDNVELFSHNISAVPDPGPHDDPNNLSLHRLVSPPASPASPLSNPPSPPIPEDTVHKFITDITMNITLEAGWVLPMEFILDPTSTVEQVQGSIDRLWCLTVGERPNGSAGRRIRSGGLPNLDGRRGRYAYVQRLYRCDRSRLAEGLLNNTLFTNPAPAFTADEACEAYSDIFGTLSQPDEEYISDPVQHDIELYQPISADELRNALKARQSDARGPDGIRMSDIRRMSQDKVLVLFNLILFSSTIPNEWRLNRTILIPKPGCDNANIDTWRPLTVSSAGLRLFNKIMASRFAKLPLCVEQRGFRSIDGTLANTITLQAIIKENRASARPFSISTLDLRKAFDTVSHHSVMRALSRYGLHRKIINLVCSNYTNCSTKINIGGETTRNIPINRGVKQGDPLSPILFNLVMDEAISRLRATGAGLSVGGLKICTMAYADDLIVFTETKGEMQRALRLLERDLSKRGMSFNAAKCCNLTCSLLPSKSKLYVSTNSTIVINGRLIKQVSVSDQFRYLGYNYGFMGARVSALEELPEQLRRIAGAPLKPQQKLSIIKTYLIPRYIYLLQNPAVTLKTLSSVDRQIRLVIKKSLHLPLPTTNAALYTPTRQGGLGVMSFRSRIPGILLRRIDGLLARDDDTILASTLSLGYVANLRDKLVIWCQGFGTKPEQVASYWASRLESSASGGGIWQVGVQGGSWGLVDNPPHWWSGEDFVRALQLRFNVLPTKGGLHNRSGDTACRAGCARRETLCHVLQACPATHHQRINRHDRVVNKLYQIANQRGLQAEKEPRIRDAAGALHIPDLVLKRDGSVLVADVAIHWEGPDTLAVSGGRKTARYSGRSFLEAMSARYPGCSISVTPFIVGARGGWCPTNNEVSRWLCLTRSQVDLISSYVVKGGWLIHSSFSTRIWVDHQR